MELALSVAADSTWPVHIRRSALLLVSVLCRGSSEAADHFRQLEVSIYVHFSFHFLCSLTCLGPDSQASVDVLQSGTISHLVG